MILIMLVTLYTSRVILAALGVDDYGIYTVVAGFVSLFTVISGSLSAGISRFITFELGKESQNRTSEVFNTSLVVQLVIFGIVLLIAETAGLWFINNKLNISQESQSAVNWVYQLSLLTFLFNLLSVPYTATIIAHEKMSAFAYISIIEVCLKLLIAFIISYASSHRLVLYAFLLMMVAIVIRIIYAYYCSRKFEECKLTLDYDSSIFKQILSFCGWNFIGAASGTMRDQGVNVLYNLFFGSIVNAAKGITEQVNAAFSSLVQNFMAALNPQIIKSFATNEMEDVFSLSFRGARLSFFIMFIPSTAVLYNTNAILEFWLDSVPDFTTAFTQLLIIRLLIDVISNPLVTIMLATGNIRNYQILVGGIQLLNFPLSYVAFKLGASPQVAFYIAIGLTIIALCLRLIMLKSMVGLSISAFFQEVLLKIAIVTISSCLILCPISKLLPLNLLGMFVSISICIIVSAMLAFYLGCTSPERKTIIGKIKQIVTSKLLPSK